MIDTKYMNYKQYQEIMKSERFKQSQTVKLYLDRAAHYTRIRDNLQKTYDEHPNDVLYDFIQEQDVKRIESVWNAIWVAEAEHNQGWRFLEDGSQYMTKLLIKYEGDVSKANLIEQTTNELIELYDKLQRQQQKGMWID